MKNEISPDFSSIKILVIADIIGRSGRRTVSKILPVLKKNLELDLVIANGENSAGGLGCTSSTAQELLNSGVNILTMGNHVWDKKDMIDYIVQESRIIRPANYPPGAPGQGHVIIEVKKRKIGIINLLGRIFMEPVDCPFRTVEQELKEVSDADIILVDMHAEATSEKVAMGYFLDGKVTAVWGTHTHVQTSDITVLPLSTLYVTDLGMTGPVDSIIGIKKELVLSRMINGIPVKFEVPGGITKLEGIFMEINSDGYPVSYRMISEIVEPDERN